MMSSASRHLIFAWLSLFIAGATLWFAIFGRLSEDILSVLWLLAGMFTAAFIQLTMQWMNTPQVYHERFSFDVEATRDSIAEIISAEFEEVEIADQRGDWEPSSEELLISDRTLALAKVRIDIERELRRLSFDANRSNYLSLTKAADLLVNEGVIPVVLRSAIRDILPAANIAVHGHDVPMEQAASIVRLGDDVVRALRSIPAPTGAATA